MSPAEKQENIIILNPKWTINSQGNLVVQTSLESFKTAMKYVETCREKIGTIMMLVDVPPRIQHAELLFKNKSEARNKTRRHLGMRHLGQFSQPIQDHYTPYVPDSVKIEDIRILTETLVRNIVVNLPNEQREKLPKCRNTQICTLPNSKQSAGCLEITIASILFALNPERFHQDGNIFPEVEKETRNQLHIFAQPSDNLPGEYIMEAPEYLPAGSWTRTVQK